MVGTSNLGSWNGHWFLFALDVAICWSIDRSKPYNLGALRIGVATDLKKKTFSTITTGAVFKTQMVSQKPCHSMLVGSVFGIPFFDAWSIYDSVTPGLVINQGWVVFFLMSLLYICDLFSPNWSSPQSCNAQNRVPSSPCFTLYLEMTPGSTVSPISSQVRGWQVSWDMVKLWFFVDVFCGCYCCFPKMLTVC